MTKAPLGDSADRFARRISAWFGALAVAIGVGIAAVREASNLPWWVVIIGAVTVLVAGVAFLLEQRYRAHWNLANDLQRANDELTAHLRARSARASSHIDETASARTVHGPLPHRMATVAMYHERIRNPISQAWVRAALLDHVEYATVRTINEASTVDGLWHVCDQVDRLLQQLRPTTRKARRRSWWRPLFLP